ncbi:hypothetical protein OPV22_012976 [Ensete ventricosum]|uniref:Uncharacterized protein n=1 Tax=Ensete ventricosum TaxID=4639 RepID=A0AAV8R4C5_ENSVE|nr:hypothetical protein OPV22_012976 [Ensete ventricosum]
MSPVFAEMEEGTYFQGGQLERVIVFCHHVDDGGIIGKKSFSPAGHDPINPKPLEWSCFAGKDRIGEDCFLLLLLS